MATVIIHLGGCPLHRFFGWIMATATGIQKVYLKRDPKFRRKKEENVNFKVIMYNTCVPFFIWIGQVAEV